MYRGYNPRNLLVILIPLFAFAVYEEYILKNPTLDIACVNIKVNKIKSEKDKALTDKQQNKLINFLINSKFLCKYTYLFLLSSGLRIVELTALKFVDVDIENKIKENGQGRTSQQ